MKLFSSTEWCAQVTLTPLANKMVVFSKGMLNGLKAQILVGGQDIPISWVGLNLLWKKAQKNLKKNKTSDVMNKIIPHRRPFITFVV